MDLQVSKFVFKNSLHLGETFFFCWCDIFSFFEFILLGNSSSAPAFSFNQINKLPENLYFTIGTVSAISPSLQWPRCFNNTILYHNEAIKNAVVIQNNSLSFRPSFSNEGTFSVTAREQTRETFDWRPQKLRFQQRGKTLLGRVLVVTTVSLYPLISISNTSVNIM